MASPFYTAEHEAYREVVRRFVEKEIEPYAHEWDEAGGFRACSRKAAEIGLLGLGFPEEYGGTEVDNFMWIVAVQELARAGAGVSASLKSNSIGAPPIARQQPPDSKRGCCRKFCQAKISALAITEAERRLRRRQPAHVSPPGRRHFYCRQRREDVHHLRHAGRLPLRPRCGPAVLAPAASACW